MEFNGSSIDIVQYSADYREQLEAFELEERQMIYSSLPIQVLEEGLMDHNRRPCVVLNKRDEVVGFFVLHQYYQHEGYETPINAVYVRSLSINSKYQGHGYGTEIMMNIPEFVQSVFPDFEHLYLVVDAENQAAWNLYERAGFLHLATNPEGPIGKERLYYLDLSGQYVSKLKLIKQDDKIVLDKDGEDVGSITLEIKDNAAHIIDFSPDNEEVRESSLRQLATYVRKYYPEVDRISVESDEQEQFLKVNFVQQNPDQPMHLIKLIKY